MSSSEFGREVAEINEMSTIPELIGLLISSFQCKEFKLVQEILENREKELETKFQKEQKERILLEKIRCDLELEILGTKEDLKKLQHENSELEEELKKLKREKLETVQKFLEYEERMAKLEKAVLNVFRVDASDVKTQTCDSLENGLQKKGNNNLDCKKYVEHATNHHEYVRASYDVQPPSGSDDKTLKTRKDLLSRHSNPQLDIEDACDTPEVGIDGLKKEDQSDSLHAADSQSINKLCQRSQPPIVVEITESDDEALCDEKPNVLAICSSKVNSSKKGVMIMESGSNGCPKQDKSKRDVRNSSLDNLLLKRKRSLTASDDSQTVKERCQGLHIASRKLYFDSSDDSSDSEDKCSDSVINKMIESLRQNRRKSQKIWNFTTDMKLEFQTNNELCMNAVCALYRREISTKKSINYASSPINLSQFNEIQGKDIAEYLIDGDPEYKLKRTVSEVQQKDPTLLDKCRELAVANCGTLFDIYRKDEDPFFPPRS